MSQADRILASTLQS